MFSSVGISAVSVEAGAPRQIFLVADFVTDGIVQDFAELLPADVWTFQMVFRVGAQDSVQQSVIAPGVDVELVEVRLCE